MSMMLMQEVLKNLTGHTKVVYVGGERLFDSCWHWH